MSSYQMRFLVVVTPVLAILTAEAAGRAATRIGEIGAWAKRSVYVAIGLVLVLDLPPFTRLHEGNRVGREGWLTHVVRSIPLNVVLGRISEEAYLQRAVSSYAAWQYINDHLPADVRVLTFSGGDHFYSDRARLWSDATLTRAATWGAAAGEEDAVLARLRALGVSHVLFDRQQLEALEPGSVAIAQPTFVNRWLVKEYRDEGFVLYRLRRKAASSQPR